MIHTVQSDAVVQRADRDEVRQQLADVQHAEQRVAAAREVAGLAVNVAVPSATITVAASRMPS